MVDNKTLFVTPIKKIREKRKDPIGGCRYVFKLQMKLFYIF
jgi:hypothetical protein